MNESNVQLEQIRNQLDILKKESEYLSEGFGKGLATEFKDIPDRYKAAIKQITTWDPMKQVTEIKKEINNTKRIISKEKILPWKTKHGFLRFRASMTALGYYAYILNDKKFKQMVNISKTKKKLPIFMLDFNYVKEVANYNLYNNKTVKDFVNMFNVYEKRMVFLIKAYANQPDNKGYKDLIGIGFAGIYELSMLVKKIVAYSS